MSDIVLIFGIFCLTLGGAILSFGCLRVANNLYGNTKELGAS